MAHKRARTGTQAKVLQTLKEYKDPITGGDLAKLLGNNVTKQQIQSAVHGLLNKRVSAPILKTKDPFSANRGRHAVLYQYDTDPIQPNESEFVHKLKPEILYELSKPAFVQQASSSTTCNHTKTNDNHSALMRERCYHLILAMRTLSSGYLADLFDIPEEDAVVLINRTAQQYKDNIKIIIRAEVR